MKITAMVIHQNGTFFYTDEKCTGFYLWLGIGYGEFKYISPEFEQYIYELKSIVHQCNQPLYPVFEGGAVLYSRQEAILADQRIAAYLKGLEQSC